MAATSTLTNFTVTNSPSTKSATMGYEYETAISLPTTLSCTSNNEALKRNFRKPGILRLDITKSKRSSVEFYSAPLMLDRSSSPTAGTPQQQLSVTWAFPHTSCSNLNEHTGVCVENSLKECAENRQQVTKPLELPLIYGENNNQHQHYLSSPISDIHTDDYSLSPDKISDNEYDEEDYSASVSAIMQYRASVRSYQRKSSRHSSRRHRRKSTSQTMDHILDNIERRRSSVFTTSSEEGTNQESTQEQILENIRLHKEVIQSVKLQPWPMRKKLKLVRQAKTYVARHEGALQERFAMSRNTRDLWARFKILMAARWRHWKRETLSFLTVLIPWELRIKEIESHFGSGVASYFTFLRWLMWVNVIIALPLVIFVIGPEYFATKHDEVDPRKKMTDAEYKVAGNLFTIWEFEGYLKYSPMFYGYYSDYSGASSFGYNLPLAYFLTSVVVYIYSFVAILRKMAENSRNSKLSSKDDECTFSWKLFIGWDFMIGHAETAHNRVASVVVGFKEALLEEAEKKKDKRNWRIILQRILVNLLVMTLLAASGYTVVTLVNKSEEWARHDHWLSRNAVNVTMTLFSFFLPMIFEALGLFENWHPRQQLRLQLARIMILNLLNLYSLMFSFIYKINSKEKPLSDLKLKNDSAAFELMELEKMWKEISLTTTTTTIGPFTTTTTLEDNDSTTEDYITKSATNEPIVENRSTLEIVLKAIASEILSTTLSKIKCYNITAKCSKLWDMGGIVSTAATTLIIMNITTTTMLPPFTTDTDTEQFNPLPTMTETLLPSVFDSTLNPSSSITINDDYSSSSYNYEVFSKSTITIDDYTTTEVPFKQITTTTTTSELPFNETYYDYYYYDDYMQTSTPEYFRNIKSHKTITTKEYNYGGMEPDNQEVVAIKSKDRLKRFITNISQFNTTATTTTPIPYKSKYSHRGNIENYGYENFKGLSSTEATTMEVDAFWQPNKRVQQIVDYFATSTYPTIKTTATTKIINNTHNIVDDNNVDTTPLSNYSTSVDNMNTTPVEGIILNTIINDAEITSPSQQYQQSQQHAYRFINETGKVVDNPTTTPYFINPEHVWLMGMSTPSNNNNNNNNYIDKQVSNDDSNVLLCIRTICELIPTHLYTTTTTITDTTDWEVTTNFTNNISPSKTAFTIHKPAPLSLSQQYQQNLTRLKRTFKEIERNLTSMCWETSLGQELSKVIVLDGFMSIVAPLCIDFLRALFVRYANRNCCWDMEKTFPQYGDFKIAENILTLINNQGQVWMAIFFSPGLVLINLVKLVIMMYFRSWIVLTCNVPHEVVFKASKSNNFYLSLLLTMLFLCVLPVGYAIVWLRPSWHCGPFSHYNRISEFITDTTRNALPKQLHRPLNYLTSASTVIPLLLLLILIIYYLVSLTGALREANQDLRTQLQKEREEERKKIFKINENKPAENTAATLTNRWRKVLEASSSSPVTPTQNPNFENEEFKNQARKELVARIMKRALRKSSATSEEDTVRRDEDDTDTEHHDSLPLDEEGGDKSNSKTKQTRKTRRPSFVDIVQIAKNEIEREKILAKGKDIQLHSQTNIAKLNAKDKDESKVNITAKANINNAEVNTRIINERRESLMCRQKKSEENAEKLNGKNVLEKSIKLQNSCQIKSKSLEESKEQQVSYYIKPKKLDNQNVDKLEDEKNHICTDCSAKKSEIMKQRSLDDYFKVEIISETKAAKNQQSTNKLVKIKNDDRGLHNVEQPSSYKIMNENPHSSQIEQFTPPLSDEKLPYNILQKKSVIEPEVFKFEVDKIRELQHSVRTTSELPEGAVKADLWNVPRTNFITKNDQNLNKEELTNNSKCGRKKFGTLMTLVRDVINNKKLDIEKASDIGNKPETVIKMPLSSENSPTPFAYALLPENSRPLQSDIKDDTVGLQRQDSQRSNWSVNIPTIRISPISDIPECREEALAGDVHIDVVKIDMEDDTDQ